MPSKYTQLLEWLNEPSRQQSDDVEVSFSTIDTLVGGLPASARNHRAWWSNSAHQAAAWREAGWQVAMVNLTAGRVRFIRGTNSGTTLEPQLHATGKPSPPAPSSTARGDAMQPNQTYLDDSPSEPLRSSNPAGSDIVDVRLRFAWVDVGPIGLDRAGDLAFPSVPAVAGIYRLWLAAPAADGRPQVYIGQSDHLRRRMVQYRRPGSSQRTNVRLNALLIDHLRQFGAARLAICTSVDLLNDADVDGAETINVLELAVTSGRLLAEAVAIATVRTAGWAVLVNLT